MSDEIKLAGLGVAPGVIDTIVTLAAEAVDGIAAVGSSGLAGLVQKGAKGASRAVDVVATDEGSVEVNAHVQVVYGQQLLEVGGRVQSAIADAIASQVGVPVSAVNVYIDGICFEK